MGSVSPRVAARVAWAAAALNLLAAVAMLGVLRPGLPEPGNDAEARLGWISGLALSATTLAGSQAGQFWNTAALMPLFVLWAALVGLWLSRRAS